MPRSPGHSAKIAAQTARHLARRANAGRYMRIDAAGTFEVASGRPNNQSTAAVRRKTAELIEAEIPLHQQKDTTRAYLEGHAKGLGLSEMNNGAGLHMAHGRSIDELKRTVVHIMNALARATQPEAEAIAQAVEEFAAGWISSDAEDEDEVIRHVRVMTDRRLRGASRYTSADALLRRFNRVSRNLVGADPSENSSIGGAQDPAAQVDGTEFPKMKVRSQRLTKLQKKLGMKPAPKLFDAAGEVRSSTKDYGP